tara:strand:- start:3923 stop:4528 length:606 start_codon:yes stop_codon:yes gene_type:complete
MNIKYPLLIPIIGHGATDFIDFPIQTLIYNLFSAILVYNLNSFQRKTLLTSSSIFHIVQDIPKKIIIKNKIYNIQNIRYLISGIIHVFWIKNPIIAKLHLLCIHTPLHYLRCFIIKKKYKLKYSIGAFISIIGAIFLQKNYDHYFNLKYGELWWIAPIIPHILLNYKINQSFINKKINFYKHNKYKYYLQNYIHKNYILNI